MDYESPREMRIFVSSTFRDMREERDVLIKHIFPQIRKSCEARGVTFNEVDLRWGIPDEEKAEGRVLSVCLEEIKRCRPYFIGLLGERYGWIPDEAPRGLLEAEPWLRECERSSITELEIVHGVINNPPMVKRALFYFRDPAYVRSLPSERQGEYLEGPSQEEVQLFGEVAANERAKERTKKLAELKERILRSSLPMRVRVNYQNPDVLGRLVLEDLMAVIDQDFPKEELIDPLAIEAAGHEAFARSRTTVQMQAREPHGIYIGRKEYFEALDNHASSGNPPLVITGDAGSGKSALLSNWGRKYRHEHPTECLLFHFIGATPQSADWGAMLRRLMGEFKQRFGIHRDIPDHPDVLKQAFTEWLHLVASRGRVVLILDAIDKLEDKEGAPDLVWLPVDIPPEVRLIISALPGRALDELKKRKCLLLRIEPLKPDERMRMAVEYLAQYRKRLPSRLLDEIAVHEQCSNPLYLRVLLDEIRVFGIHEELGNQVRHYLSADSIPKLYEKVLKRWEEDYEADRPGLVRASMTALWAARRGLTETELLQLLGSEEEPLPRAHFSPFWLAAEPSLLNKSGFIGFSHDYLRHAVEDKYLGNADDKRNLYLRLANYFRRQDLGARKVEELPWQLSRAEAWQALADLLADEAFFRAAYDASQYDVRQYWLLIESHMPAKVQELYSLKLATPEISDPLFLQRFALLLGRIGHVSESSSLHQHLASLFKKEGDYRNAQAAIGNQASALLLRGHLDEALDLFGEQEEICRRIGAKTGLQGALGNQALVYQTRGNLNKALALFKEQQGLSQELNDKDSLQFCLGCQALIFKTWGDLDQALSLSQMQETVCRESENMDGLSVSLGIQGYVMRCRGQLEEALELHKKEESICRRFGKKQNLQASLGNQAQIFIIWRRFEEAMALLKEQEGICRELQIMDGLQTSLYSQAEILRLTGRLDDAHKLLREQEQLCRDLGSKDGLQASLSCQAQIHRQNGHLDMATALLKKQEEICREIGDQEALQSCLGNQAAILISMDNLEEAMSKLKEQEEICLQIESYIGLQSSYGNQAVIFQNLDSYNIALSLFKNQERICRGLKNPYYLGISLANQAILLADKLDKPVQGLELAEEAQSLAREHGFQDLLNQFKDICAYIRSRI